MNCSSQPSELAGPIVARRIVGVLLVGVLAFAGCSSTTDEANEGTIDGANADGSTETTTLGYKYFGAAQISSGSSLELIVDGVTSVDDIQVVDAPTEVEVSFRAGDDGTPFLNLKIDGDAESGPRTIVFAIEGEPDPVSWTFDVL